jgi:Big-like domain-containing protein
MRAYPLFKKVFQSVLLFSLLSVALVGCGGGGGDDDFNPPPAQPFPTDNSLPPLNAFFDSYEGVEDTILQVDELFGILSNDEYPIGETEIEYPLGTVNGGDIEGFQNGAFEYEPPAGFLGQDSFTYTLRDRNGRTSSAEVFISVFPVDFRTTTE